MKFLNGTDSEVLPPIWAKEIYHDDYLFSTQPLPDMIQVQETIKERVLLNCSSLLHCISYDFAEKKLEVTFKRNRKTKSFPQVNLEEYQSLLNAPSIGKAFLKWEQRKESSKRRRLFF